MVIALGIIIFIIGCCLSSYEDNTYNAQRREEKRFKELMHALDESRNSAPQAPRRTKQVRRRFVQDKDGNLLGEEIMEEELED
jgi:hypothetical protein